MHILLVEDDAPAARTLELALNKESHNVTVTGSGEEAVELADLYDYDAILLDLDLEDMGGLEALRALRLKKVATPVIILTGETHSEVKIQALTAGADDYVTKPFHRGELVARIAAVVRRSRGQADSIITTGKISLNLSTRQVAVCGNPIHLTPSEFKMLELLSLRKNAVLTKEACLNHLYNGLGVGRRSRHRDGLGRRLHAARRQGAGDPPGRLIRNRLKT